MGKKRGRKRLTWRMKIRKVAEVEGGNKRVRKWKGEDLMKLERIL